jgi:hypothetical protein
MKTRAASPFSILTTSTHPSAWCKPKSQVADVGQRNPRLADISPLRGPGDCESIIRTKAHEVPSNHILECLQLRCVLGSTD